MTGELVKASNNALIELVANAVSSTASKRAYSSALSRFFVWHAARPKEPFTRALVHAYRSHLEQEGKRPATINVAMAALRTLAKESHAAGLIDDATARQIMEVRYAKMEGLRVGNWLTVEQSRELLRSPNLTTKIGRRDRALLALLLGCAVRREECSKLTIEHIQQRDGRWCIVDIVGKRGRVRTIPMPGWAALDVVTHATGSGIVSGRIFDIGASAIWYRVKKYSNVMGIKFSPHDLRRTQAKLAKKGGADLEQIQFTLGHSSIATTQRYLGTDQNLTDAPADRLGIF